MTVQTTALRQSDFVASVESDVYVATTKTLIDKCSSSAVLGATVTLRIVESAGSSGPKHQQGKKTFLADESYTWPEIVGQTLNPGDKITGVCTVASAVTLRISGRLISS